MAFNVGKGRQLVRGTSSVLEAAKLSTAALGQPVSQVDSRSTALLRKSLQIDRVGERSRTLVSGQCYSSEARVGSQLYSRLKEEIYVSRLEVGVGIGLFALNSEV